MFDLPEEYKKFVKAGSLEGELSIDPGWYQLWPLDQVAELNRNYEIEEFAPGFLAFGSNGGGEIFAFDHQYRIYMLPASACVPTKLK